MYRSTVSTVLSVCFLVALFNGSNCSIYAQELKRPELDQTPVADVSDVFEEAYSLYRKEKMVQSQNKLRLLLKHHDSGDALALHTFVQSVLVVQESVQEMGERALTLKKSLQKGKISERDEMSARDEIFRLVSDMLDTFREDHKKLNTIAKGNPTSAVIQELLGEYAGSMAQFLSTIYIPMLDQAGRDSDSAQMELRDLKRAAFVAYEKSVQLDSQHAFPYVRLVGRIGDVKQPRVAEYLLQAIEKAPDDPQSIRLLALTMWQSGMLSDLEKATRVQQALSQVDGAALVELKKVKRELDEELLNLTFNRDGATASGVFSLELERSFRRLSKTLAIIESAMAEK